MISLRKSVSAFDELEALQRALLQSYTATLEDLQETAIPLRGDSTRHHREVLKSIEARIESASTPKEIEKARVQLREELADYQRQGGVMIEGLRESVTTISRVLEEVTSSLSEDASAETDAIAANITRLQALATTNDVEQIRNGLKAVITGITSSVESLRRQNRLIVAQFREEIRTLHAQIKSAQTPPQLPAAASPARIEAPQSQVKAPESATFSLLAIWIKNWGYTLNTASPATKNQAFDSFTLALTRALGYRPVLNRYEEDLLMTRLNVAQTDAIQISKDLSAMTWPDFPLGDDRRPIQWRVVTGIVSGRNGESSDKLMGRFEQLVQMLKRSS